MRRSKRTNTLVIVSDHTKPFYEDFWMGDVLHYTGMGQKGDQSLDFMQNRTLRHSNTNGVDVHLFEVFEQGRYIYQGEVELVGEPYQKIQRDFEGNKRLTWMFPVKVIDGEPYPVLQEVVEDTQTVRERQLRKLSTAEIFEKVRGIPPTRATRRTMSDSYVRDPYVSMLAKRRADGHCQLCGEEAPFRDRYGEPFLETHHVNWLSRGGEDVITNTVALCPNCHRKMHVLDRKRDKEHLKDIAEDLSGISSHL